MNKNKSTKWIGLNQRVPLSILDAALVRFLETGAVDRNQIQSLISAVTKGKNRAKKASELATAILSSKNGLLDALKKKYNPESYSRLNERERFMLNICLVSLRYPIVYNTLCLLATQFKIQSSISRAFIKQKLAILYGSNRSLDHAIDALIPMIIESGVVVRTRIGIYALNSTSIQISQFVKEAWILTELIMEGYMRISVEDIIFKPWLLYLSVDQMRWDSCVLLRTSIEAGQGVLIG